MINGKTSITDEMEWRRKKNSTRRLWRSIRQASGQMGKQIHNVQDGSLSMNHENIQMFLMKHWMPFTQRTNIQHFIENKYSWCLFYKDNSMSECGGWTSVWLTVELIGKERQTVFTLVVFRSYTNQECKLIGVKKVTMMRDSPTLYSYIYNNNYYNLYFI